MDNARFDQYCAAALAALISKFPLHDALKEHGTESTQEEVDQIHADLCASAIGYATEMMKQLNK